MEKKVLKFRLIELRKVVNNKGAESIMLKLFCPEYVKSTTTLGDFEVENTGQLTYYLFVKNLPKGYELGEQKEPKEYDLEHYYEGAGVWLPTGYNIVERDVTIKDTDEVVRCKSLKSL